MSTVSTIETVRTADHPLRRSGHRRAVAVLSLVLLIVSLLAWRTGVYYTGGIDPTILAKSAMGFAAFLLAVHLVHTAGERHWVGLTTVGIVTAYLAVTVVGSWAGGGLVASVVLAVRVALVMVTMVCLVTAIPLDELLGYVIGSLAIVGLTLAVTGLPSMGGAGRLAGGVLPVNPNQLALLLGPPALGCLWRLLNARARRADLTLLLVCIGLTWLTGSRTGLIALAAGALVLIVMAPRIHVATLVGVALAVPVTFYLVSLTPLFASYFGRGGSDGAGSVTTLNSRTIAWQAAFSAPADFWQRWFGGGLSVKTVAVSGTYWDTQVLDSSWVSTFVQAGVLGLLLLGLWVVCAGVGAARTAKPYRGLLLALVLYAAIRSVLETGLLDAYVLFVVMLFPALAVETRRTARRG